MRSSPILDLRSARAYTVYNRTRLTTTFCRHAHVALVLGMRIPTRYHVCLHIATEEQLLGQFCRFAASSRVTVTAVRHTYVV